MKKPAVFLIFLLFVSLSSQGQKVKHVSFDFCMDDFEVRQDDGITVILFGTQNYFLKSDTLQPALPYIGCNVLIANTEQYDRYVCSSSTSLVRSNVTMAQNPKAFPTNMRPLTKRFTITNE